MLALRVLLHAAIGVAFSLLAAWLGLNAWAEIERGWWREEAQRSFEGDSIDSDSTDSAPIDGAPTDWSVNDNDGWAFYAQAHDWYRTFAAEGGEPAAVHMDINEVWAGGLGEDIATYVVKTQPFVDLLGMAVLQGAVRAPIEDGMAATLSEQVRLVLSWRIRHHLAQPDGMREALDALHTLFLFVRTLPSSSLPIAGARTSLLRTAITELRTVSIRRAFPAAESRPAFDEHLRALESDADIVDALLGDRTHIVCAIDAKLEPGATSEDWQRPSWRALTLGGEQVPMLYRDATQRLHIIGTAIERLQRGETDLSDLTDMAMVERLLARRSRTRAAARITRLGLAAIEFHVEHGEWPKDPSLLEPRFRDGMPVDPISGQFFPFQSTRDELTLSSSEDSFDDDSWTLRRKP